MISQLWKQFLLFSKENPWIYVLLALAVIIVFITDKGNIWEIIIIFFLNLAGNLFFLLMQDSYKDKNYSTGSLFLFFSNLSYICVSVYGFYYNQEYQYLLWQIPFNLAGIQNIIRYNFHKNASFINVITMSILGCCILGILLLYFDLRIYAMIQSIGFFLTTVAIVMHNDTKRFFILFLASGLILIGSLIGLYINYTFGLILGITIGFVLLTLNSFLYYIRVCPQYIKRL